MTEDPSRGQGRGRREVLSPLRFEPYEVVALASGGEVIFTKDQYIQDVAAVVGDSMAGWVSVQSQWFQLRPEGDGRHCISFSWGKGMTPIAMLPQGVRRVGKDVYLPGDPWLPTFHIAPSILVPPFTPPLQSWAPIFCPWGTTGSPAIF